MKKTIPLLLVFLLAVWIGCGGDDDNGPGPTPDVAARVVVNNTAGAPAMLNANEAVWDAVEEVVVDVVRAGALPAAGAPAVITATATMQAIVAGDDLYVRLQWDDTSFNVWKEHYYVVDTFPFVSFNPESDLGQSEDQLFVMFKDSVGGYWDTWNWRSLTTGAGGFAEGFNYVDSPLTVDAAGSKIVEIQWKNPDVFGDPTYVHEDTSEFDHYILYLTEKLHRLSDVWYDTTNIIDSIDTMVIGPGETLYDTFFVVDEITWPFTRGWEIGQRVPGWMIDGEAQFLSEGELGSRWDTRAVMDYDSTDGVYTVVLKRKLTTGYDDDLDMSPLDSVMTRLVIVNNGSDFFRADTWRGTSKEIWLVF